MVQGRPIRSCTKNNMLYSEARKIEGTMTRKTPQSSLCPSAKSRSITDYFQRVEIPEEKSVDKIHASVICTRSKANFLPEPQQIPTSVQEIIDIERKDDPIEQVEIEENCPLPVINELKSPPTTPHRITLCTEALDEKSLVKNMEVKSFQKPIIRPKARKKLNTNRFNVLEEAAKSSANRKITDYNPVNNYFPVRRSVRKTKTTVLEEKQRSLEKALRNNVEDGLKITYFNGKGRGIVADKPFKRGDFVVEYSGDLIEISEAKRREETYAVDQNAGCYMYYFEHNNHRYCIDATPESERLGRLVNHSRNGNLMTKSVTVDGKPRLVLIAKEDIEMGQELLYDYGDRSRESLKHHPWLAY